MRPWPCNPDAAERELAPIARKSDGRRIFTDAFKRRQIDRILRGEMTLQQLSRKLGIAPSLLHRWKRLMRDGDGIAGAMERSTSGRGGPAGSAAQYIRELQLLVGKQTVELELLRARLDSVRRQRRNSRGSRR